MLTKPPIEKLLPKADNRYILTMMTAKRARQLVDGALPLSEELSPSVVTTAAHELAEGKIHGVKGKVEISVPLRPEVAAAKLEEQRLAKAKSDEAMIEDNRRRESGADELHHKLEQQALENKEQSLEQSMGFAEELLKIFDSNAEEHAREAEENEQN